MTDEPQLKKIHPLDIPLEVFLEDLPTRPRRIINAEMGYFASLGDEHIKPPFTVRHLMMFSRKEIRDWPNMGKKSLNEIEEWLRNLGQGRVKGVVAHLGHDDTDGLCTKRLDDIEQQVMGHRSRRDDALHRRVDRGCLR